MKKITVHKCCRKRLDFGTIIKYAILTVLAVILFLLLHRSAEVQRGYTAIGGEGLILALPLIWFVIEKVFCDFAEEKGRRL